VLTDNWATFKTTAGEGSPATVQWQMSTDNGNNFVPAPGGIAPTYSFSALLALTGSQYRAIWNTFLGPAVTRPATLTVSSLPQPATRLFVSNSAGRGMVEQYDAASGAFTSNFAPVDAPKGIVLDPLDGAVLVASATANQILKFNGQTAAPAGVFVDGTVPCAGSTLNGPAGVIFGPDSHLYVADTNNNRVVKYDGLTGACHGSYASGATLNLPNGLVFGRDGYLYVANLGGTVARFAPVTGVAAGVVNVGTAPAGIAISPSDDNLYVTDRVAAGQVYVVGRSNFPATPPTVFVSSPAGGLSNPEGLVFGPDNHLYVASTATNQVQKFNGATGALLSSFISNVPAGVSPTFLTFGASTSVAASGASATFNPNNQSVTLSAAVTSSAGTVNTGTVAFSVFDGSTQIGSATTPVAVTNGTATASFTLPGGTPAGPYSIRATYSGAGAFKSSSDNTQLLTVNQATPLVSWSNPAGILFGSALSSQQLRATANVPGTFVYTPPAGTVLPVGNGQTLTVLFTPTDTRSYRTATASVQINVTAGGPASLIATNTLARQPGTNNVIATMTIANTGGSPATAVQVNAARIGATLPIGGLPVVVGDIPARGSLVVTFTFPGSVGATGLRTVLATSGTYSGGSFSQSARVVLP
jgi:DNA-binding beta-propeller fold protein YncE